MKLWLNEHRSIELDERTSLSREVAIRSRSIDWLGFFNLLPDPDTVLQKTGQDVTVYRRTLEDSHTFACYLSRKSGTLSREWQIIPAEKGSAGPSKAAFQLISEMMDKLDVYQIITEMLEAPFFGFAPIEVVWKAAETAWLPQKIEGKPPEWFAFDADNRLRFLSINDMIMGEEVPDKKFLLPRHHASYQNPYGERILSRCFWPVVFKKGGFKFWAIFTEKYGMPWLVGKVPRSTHDTERARLLANLTKMVQDAVAVINNDESIDIAEAGGKKASADIYENLIAASNKEISKATLGQTGTTEGTPGKLGNETAQMEVRADLVDQDKRMVAQAFNTLFQWITDMNAKGAAAPQFSFYEEKDIHTDLAERDERLVKQGVRLSRKYYMRTYNLDEDDLLEEIRDQRSEVRDQRSEIRDQRSEVRDQKTEASFSVIPAKAGIQTDRDLSPAGTLDALGEKTLAAADMKGLLGPVEDLLSSVNSLGEFQDRLTEVYGDMDESALGALMAQGLALANLSGRFDAGER